MKVPIRKLKKDQIIWLGEHYCKHGVSYLEHYNCYLREHPEMDKEKIGFLDIETTGFYADYDFMLSYCILDDDTNTIYSGLITPSEIKKLTFDKRLVKDLVKDMRRFDRLIVYNGVDYRFDIPFARTRALRWGLDFPSYREIFVNDVYGTVKQKLRLSRKKLANACGLLDIPAKEHTGDPNIWMRAAVGDKEALDYILVHNIEDVQSLKELYHKVEKFMLIGKRSI